MDNDLNRSVRLLEDVLSTPERGLFKRNISKKHPMNLSVTMNVSEMNYLISNQTLPLEQTLAGILDDKSVTGSVIQNNQPWRSTLDSLYTEFFEVLQGHTVNDILEIITDLARCSSDTLKVVQGLKSKVACNTEEEKWLENERNTWRLLFILYQDRLHRENLIDQDMPTQYFGKSEKSCVENLFKRDNLIRETQLVIDWLECNAAEKDDQVLLFSDSTFGWENTLHQLQSADTIAFGSSRQTVTQLDPDAPNYLKKPLHDLDTEDEKRLNRRIFNEIRCGKLEEAQRLCQSCGHAWKAALFEGWRLYHNANIKENGEEERDKNADDEEIQTMDIEELEGNAQRDIWKLMALRFSKQDCLDPYERASVAAFCGCVEPILQVSNSWEDNLWAYMKSIVDIRVESEIRDCCVRNDTYVALPESYWAQRMSLDDVFNCLESSKNTTVKEESQKVEHIIQKLIILDEIPKLLNELEDWVSEPSFSTQFLRFSAHLVLFLDQVGPGYNRESIERVLEAYIQRLMEMKETQLVAFYVSKLSHSHQVFLYTKYLEKIVEQEERKSALLYAEDSNLDIFAITKQIVENIRNMPYETVESGNLQHKISDLDKFKISALDWVLFYENQATEALIQCNAMIFSFLTFGKLDAAQIAFNKLPSNIVQNILKDGHGNEELNLKIKEHLSYDAYLKAHESFNEWFKQCKGKPVPPKDLPETAQFPEKVAHQHRVSQYQAEIQRWKLTTSHLAKTAKTNLYNVLLFPEGWLEGARDSDYLRSKCIPEIVLLLYSVLYESELHEECVQLADIIASEKYALYKVYSKEKLGEILVKLCESSVALLNMKKDPWGNEATA